MAAGNGRAKEWSERDFKTYNALAICVQGDSPGYHPFPNLSSKIAAPSTLILESHRLTWLYQGDLPRGQVRKIVTQLAC